MMQVCFFGTYTIAEGYPVNRVLVKGLRRAGVSVDECREELWGPFLYKSLRWWGVARILAGRVPLAYARVIWRYLRSPRHDCVIVGYAGHVDVLLARVLNRRRRLLVLVSFISLYDTLVLDRQRVTAGSMRARLLKWIDWLAFSAADLVLVDSDQLRHHYSELFGLRLTKFHRSFVGEDDDEFRPTGAPRRSSPEFRVLFFGTYVPLHGIDVILDAAELLSDEGDIAFTLIGNGQLFPALRGSAAARQLSNVRFVEDWVGTADLVRFISEADVSLGIFGTTAKAGRVIPYKVFDALAMKKPVVTRDSPAIREILDDGVTALLCAPGSGESLARSVKTLQDDDGLRNAIGEAGYECFRRYGSPQAIGQALLDTLKPRLDN